MKKDFTQLIAEMLLYIFGFGLVEFLIKKYFIKHKLTIYTIVGIIGFILYYN